MTVKWIPVRNDYVWFLNQFVLFLSLNPYLNYLDDEASMDVDPTLEFADSECIQKSLFEDEKSTIEPLSQKDIKGLVRFSKLVIAIIGLIFRILSRPWTE